jgi:RNA polymerase sigma-70 factor (ECF subfamily)
MTMPSEVAVAVERSRAFEELFREDFGRLVGFLRSLGASRAEAQDMAAEAFELLYQRWDSVQHPRAWLRTVGDRRFRQTRLQEQIAARRLEAWPREDIVDSRGADYPSDWEMVVELVRSLPPQQRAVMACVIDGLDPAEILSMSKDTVRSHLRHARRTLRERLERQQGV